MCGFLKFFVDNVMCFWYNQVDFNTNGGINEKMDSDSMTQIFILVVLILMSAYFSASETAFSSLNRIRIKNMANDGNKKAELVLKLADKFDELLSTILIGNNIVNISASSIATVMFIEFLADTSMANYGATAATVVLTIVVLIFGEITPKSLAKSSPEKFAMFSAPMLKLIITIFTPLNFLFLSWQRLAYKIVKNKDDRGITEEELLTMVEEAQNDGEIDDHESELIRNAIEFNDIEVMDIHTNRVDVVAVDIESSNDEVKSVFGESGYSRLPVYSESIDNIVGVINQKDFYKAVASGKSIKDAMNEPVYVIPSMKISQLLSVLQKQKSHMAIIVDEYGGTEGIVTLEDILEELVGEIWDEHDEIIEEFEQIGENEYKVLGSADLDDTLERFDMLVDEDDSTTIGGWVSEKLGHIPEVGEEFVYENLHIIVTKTTSRHIEEVKITIIEDKNDKDEE